MVRRARVIPGRDLPIEWGGPEQRNVLWKAPLVGAGHASPIVWGERIFVCTARWEDTVVTDAERTKVIPEHHVLCYGGTTSTDRSIFPLR